MVGPASSPAAETHLLKATFGSFAGPSGIGVDEANGYVFVADRPDTVFISGLEGEAPSGVASPFKIEGFQFGNEPSGVAVDNSLTSASRGALYVADVAHSAVEKFTLNPVSEEYELKEDLTATPGFSEPLGVSVDSSGKVLVADFGSESVIEFSPAGAELGRIGVEASVGHPSYVALDSAGDLFVQGYGNGRVYKYAANGLGEIEPGTEPAQIVSGGATGVAVDPNTDEVYVAMGDRVAQYSTAGVLETEFEVGPLAENQRIAVDAQTGDIYITRRNDVAIFGPTVRLPDAATDPAGEVSPEGDATLNGTVNPNGVELTECAFEYGTTTGYGEAVPCAESPGEIGSGEAGVPVHADLSGLPPARYHFRLIAANSNSVGGPSVGEDESFAVPGRPEVFGEVGNPTATEADLRAEINPGNAETTYRFEYGTTESYGQSTPDGTIAAGDEVVSVAAHISGLSPGAAYHFRLVATNSAGPTNGPDRTFMTEASSPGEGGGCPPSTMDSPGFRAYLPDCRAYELASPPYTGGAALLGGAGAQLAAQSAFRIAQSGERVLGASLGSFAGQESGSTTSQHLGTPYAMSRTAGGWAPEALSPSPARFPFAILEDADVNLERTLWRTGDTTYLENPAVYYLRDPNGDFAAVGPESAASLPAGFAHYRGASADLSRFVFNISAPSPSSHDVLWPGDTTVAPVEGAAGFARYSLYEYSGVGNSEPKLVGVENQQPLKSNEEAHLISECGVTLGSGSARTLGSADVYNAVSPSGFAVFFTAEAGPCEEEGGEVGAGPSVGELYARVEGARTIAISEPSLSVPGRDCSGVCREYQNEEGGHTHSPGRFSGASADGHEVLFVTAQPLVDADTDTTADLYMAELDPSGIARLVLVSGGGAGDPTPGAGAAVQGVSRISDGGSHIYFVAHGALTSEPNANGESAKAGADNLYLYEPSQERTAFVARLVGEDSADWSANDARRPAQLSEPGGRYLVFSSSAHPQGTGDTSHAAQLFEYDSADGTVTRVSIGQRGSYRCAQTGEIEVGYNCNGNIQSSQQKPLVAVPDYSLVSEATPAFATAAIAADGTVFFKSTDALTPDAVNGFPNTSPGLTNIYEYRQGNVHLISDGHEAPVGEEGGTKVNQTLLVGTIGDGQGVLFLTADSLVPQDTDTLLSLYDARVDGGFPAPPPADACAGETCRNPPSAPPTLSMPASALLHGAGNVHRANRPNGHGRKKRKHHRRHRRASGHRRRVGR
jgi:hypothetical protein